MSHIDQETPAEEQAITPADVASLASVLTAAAVDTVLLAPIFTPKRDLKEIKPNCPGSDF